MGVSSCGQVENLWTRPLLHRDPKHFASPKHGWIHNWCFVVESWACWRVCVSGGGDVHAGGDHSPPDSDRRLEDTDNGPTQAARLQRAGTTVWSCLISCFYCWFCPFLSQISDMMLINWVYILELISCTSGVFGEPYYCTLRPIFFPNHPTF